MRRAAAFLAVALLVVPVAMAAGGKVVFQDRVPSGKSSSVTIQTHRAASFSVLMRVPTAGRAKLFLLGKTAPKPGLLIDTKTFECEGAAGSFFCKAAYEPLPKGKYTWKIAWVGTPKKPANVQLTVRW
jgi:hypothetical protein